MVVFDVAVVGGGAMGAAAALHAARQGARTVLLERGAPASGTSGRGAGFVNRLLWHPLDVGLVDRSIRLLRDLEKESDGAFRYHDVGGLTIVDADRVAAAKRSLRLWRAQALPVVEMEADEIADLPGCGGFAFDEGERAYFLEGDGYAVTTEAVAAVVAAAKAAGVEVRPSTPARLGAVGPRPALSTGAGRVEAQRVVVACGVWTNDVLPAHARVPVLAYRPQAAVFETPAHGAMPTVHDVPNHTYFRPDGAGRVLAGDGTVLSPQAVDQEPPVEPGFADSVRQGLGRRIPAAAQARIVRAWGGFEAGTPDRSPLLGPVPGLDGVFVCAGGNGFGFMRSQALGEAVAHLALGRPPPVPVGEFSPARFGPWDGAPFPLREGFSLG